MGSRASRVHEVVVELVDGSRVVEVMNVNEAIRKHTYTDNPMRRVVSWKRRRDLEK